jgi:SulP family sulfate permease
LRAEWFSNVPADILAGIVVALALIPEALAFSIIAGVDPKVGLYAASASQSCRQLPVAGPE